MPELVTQGLTEPFQEGLAFQDTLLPADPAAGANLSIVVGGENWIRVLSAIATISTDANAANRFVSLDYISARGTTYVRNAAGLVVTANTTNQVFVWSEQRTDAQWATNTPVLVPVSSIFLPPGDTIRITLDSIQVGDTIKSASFVIERFPTGPRGQPVGVVPVPAFRSVGPPPAEISGG